MCTSPKHVFVYVYVCLCVYLSLLSLLSLLYLLVCFVCVLPHFACLLPAVVALPLSVVCDFVLCCCCAINFNASPLLPTISKVESHAHIFGHFTCEHPFSVSFSPLSLQANPFKRKMEATEDNYLIKPVDYYPDFPVRVPSQTRVRSGEQPQSKGTSPVGGCVVDGWWWSSSSSSSSYHHHHHHHQPPYHPHRHHHHHHHLDFE